MSETVHHTGSGGLDAVADYLRNLRLRKVVMGGVDQEDAYEAMRELTDIFADVYNEATGETEALRRRLNEAESRVEKRFTEEISTIREEKQGLEQSLLELRAELEGEKEARSRAEEKAQALEAKFSEQLDGLDPVQISEQMRRLAGERDEAKAKAEAVLASVEATRAETERLRQELADVQQLREKEQSERMLLDDIYIQAHRRKDEIINEASERAEALCAEASAQAEAIVSEAKERADAMTAEAKERADAIDAEITERESKTRAELESYQKAQLERFEADEQAFAEKQKAQEDELAEQGIRDREERSRMLAEAQSKCDMTLEEARKMASELIDSAREESEHVRAEADRYMADAEKTYRAEQARYNAMVERLSQQRTQIIVGIRKDIEALQEIAFDMSNHGQGRVTNAAELPESERDAAPSSDEPEDEKSFMQECIWEKESKAKLNTP